MGEWLESLLPWGADVIVWAQSHSTTWLDSIFRVFTALGYEEAYLIVLPLVYWCVHKQIGAALSYISLASAWANSLVKHIFLLPRPAAPPIEMRAPRSEVSPSFPSGHAQNAVVIWGYMAYRLRDWRAWPVAVTLMAGIGISRVALGVHFPQDVIGGWLIGAGLLLGYVWLAPAAARWLQRRQFGVQILLAVSLPVALILLSPSNAAGVYPVEGVVTPMAAMAGVGVGLIMERSLVGFSVEGEWWRRLLRFVVGALLTGALYLGPELLRPSEASMPHGLDVTVRFAHYAVLGWAESFLCPWLFVRLGLANGVD